MPAAHHLRLVRAVPSMLWPSVRGSYRFRSAFEAQGAVEVSAETGDIHEDPKHR